MDGCFGANFIIREKVISNEQFYNASDIEVLSGLEPVRKRPGMYTDTSRPNHLAQEVIDNSVDEAIAGHASLLEVVLFRMVLFRLRMTVVVCRSISILRGARSRGDLTKLHAGGKFRAELPFLRRSARCRCVSGQCLVQPPGSVGQARRRRV